MSYATEGVCTIKRTNEVVREQDAVWMEYSENGNTPCARLARIESIAAADVNGNVMVKVRMLYTPEETVAGRKAFHGKMELFLTDHYHTQSSDTLLRKCYLHPFLAYVRLKGFMGPDDYYFRLRYEHETGWFEPDIIDLFCKCLVPFNPDVYMIQCQACRDWYHPACINMTIDQAKQLDNFTCDREECSDASASASAADADMGEQQAGKEVISMGVLQ